MLRYQIACNWSHSSVAPDFFSMNSQAMSNSSVAPDSKPWESWKMKLLPSYVIWCSILCTLLWNLPHYYISGQWYLIIWLTNIEGIKCDSESASCLPTRWWTCEIEGLWFSLPFSSYMIGFVPCCTPQTFSRMVVLPALALPMTRIRKWGHLYRSLSITVCGISISAMWIKFWWDKYFHQPSACAAVSAIVFDFMLVWTSG